MTPAKTPEEKIAEHKERMASLRAANDDLADLQREGAAPARVARLTLVPPPNTKTEDDDAA